MNTIGKWGGTKKKIFLFFFRVRKITIKWNFTNYEFGGRCSKGKETKLGPKKKHLLYWGEKNGFKSGFVNFRMNTVCMFYETTSFSYSLFFFFKQILFPSKVEVRFVSRRLLLFPVVQSVIGILPLSFHSEPPYKKRNESMREKN